MCLSSIQCSRFGQASMKDHAGSFTGVYLTAAVRERNMLRPTLGRLQTGKLASNSVNNFEMNCSRKALIRLFVSDEKRRIIQSKVQLGRFSFLIYGFELGDPSLYRMCLLHCTPHGNGFRSRMFGSRNISSAVFRALQYPPPAWSYRQHFYTC